MMKHYNKEFGWAIAKAQVSYDNTVMVSILPFEIVMYYEYNVIVAADKSVVFLCRHETIGEPDLNGDTLVSIPKTELSYLAPMGYQSLVLRAMQFAEIIHTEGSTQELASDIEDGESIYLPRDLVPEETVDYVWNKLVAEWDGENMLERIELKLNGQPMATIFFDDAEEAWNDFCTFVASSEEERWLPHMDEIQKLFGDSLLSFDQLMAKRSSEDDEDEDGIKMMVVRVGEIHDGDSEDDSDDEDETTVH